MKRIVMHWTSGSHNASPFDRRHYHLLIEGDGSIVYGTHEISDNKNIADGNYAAHTRNLNTGSIGVAVCAMAGAEQVPFRSGAYAVAKRRGWST